jgi:transposase
MGADPGLAAWAGGACWGDGKGQPSVRGCRAVSVSGWHPVAGSAGAVRAWKAVHTRFTRWAKSGVWATLFQHLAEDADTEYAMIDSTIVRAHQHSAGAKGGIASRRRLGAARVGCRSTPPPMPWATQRASISRLGRSTIWSVPMPCCQAWRLLADKAYDADQRVIQPLEQAGIVPVIPSRSNRKTPRPYDAELYKARHLIENFFAKLKQFRAIATRYDKRGQNFLAAIYLAAAVIWLN